MHVKARSYGRRRSIRAPAHDYRDAGAYFVTVVTHQRACLFGEVIDDEMDLSPIGRITEDEWLRTTGLRVNVELDVFVVMPNHLHGIIWVGRRTERRAWRRHAPTIDAAVRISG
jgi:REP element-mobilizing transposase RayT